MNLPPLEEVKKLIHYNPETGDFTWLKREGDSRTDKSWNTQCADKKAGWKHKLGYWIITLKCHAYYAHRLAWYYVHGIDPGQKEIDHVNLNYLDNRIINLRLANRSENGCNKAKQGRNRRKNEYTSKYKGVMYRKDAGKWVAKIQKDGKGYWIGTYDTEEEASIARDEFAKTIHYGFFR